MSDSEYTELYSDDDLSTFAACVLSYIGESGGSIRFSELLDRSKGVIAFDLDQKKVHVPDPEQRILGVFMLLTLGCIDFSIHNATVSLTEAGQKIYADGNKNTKEEQKGASE